MENNMDEPTSSTPPVGAGQSQAADAGQAAQSLAAAATQTASSIVGQAGEQLAGQANAHKDGLADQIDQIADSVHRSGEQFAGKQDWLAHAIDGGAQELNALATALRENDLSSLLSHVQSFARRQPGVFVGAALAAGFAVARLGKIVASDLSRDDLPTMPGLRDDR